MTDTGIDPGTTGAKRTSWRSSNPRSILRTLIETHPDWSRDELHEEIRVRIKVSDEMIDSVIEYWFANNYHSLVNAERPADMKARKEKAEAVKDAVVQNIKTKVKIMLLELVMPNGKQLKDCTGSDCKALGAKMGGWLKSIAAKVKPNQRVGDVLSENQVRALF